MSILPTVKRSPVIDIRTLNVLIYGIPGIGKSTLANQAPGSLFFATEDGLKSMEVYELKCSSWEDIEEGIKELESIKDDPNRIFQNVVLDTVDNFILLASQSLCKKRKWEHESDGSHGAGYGLLNKMIREWFLKISNIKCSDGSPAYGLWMISHSKEMEMEERGRKWTKMVPSLSDSQRRIVEGFADLILFGDVTWEESSKSYKRILRTKPSREWIAKDRTNRLPEIVPLSLESPTGYEALVLALDEGLPPEKPKDAPRKPKDPPRDTQAQEEKESFPEDPGEPEDQQETPPPADPPKGGKKGGKPKPPKWSKELWDILEGLPEEAKKDCLRIALCNVMERLDVEWSTEWLNEHDSEINEIHRRYVKREAEKRAKEFNLVSNP